MSADLASTRIAYFSMEVGLDPRLPLYAGGLGVLAGDTLRSFADLRMPAVGVSLLYRSGYFRQTLDAEGRQHEHPIEWHPSEVLTPLAAAVGVTIAGRSVAVRAWRYDVAGISGHVIPLLLLDTDVEGNEPADRALTDVLYGGDTRHRLGQEIVLGIGGVRLLRALGLTSVERFHMNEGHSAFLALALLAEEDPTREVERDIDEVRRRCIFTTHTPVAAGHDRFSYDLVVRVLGPLVPFDLLRRLGGESDLNMTLLALNLAHFVNGVAKRHGETSQRMFPGYPIDSITNGIHSVSWTCESFRTMYDRHIPGWRRDPFSLRYAIQLPLEEVWAAHLLAKQQLLDAVKARTGRVLRPEVFTIGFARRATGYKRPGLLFHDIDRLRQIRRTAGPFQVLFAGKAHPRDDGAKSLIQEIVAHARILGDEVPVVYVPDYDIELARLFTSGADMWLNTPQPPLEASGTSGMKAAHNGIPSLSTLDGWWIEGHVEGITGWSIGGLSSAAPSDESAGRRLDAAELYRKLETIILPLFDQQPARWVELMRRTIALNASFFNSQRMLEQYAALGYV